MADFIKQINIGTITYDIDAKQFDGHTWSEIVNWKFLVCTTAANTPKGVTFTPKGSSEAITGTLEASAADTSTIYLVYKRSSGADSYDEYVAISNAWELLGNTGSIDLSNYVQKGTITLTGNTGSAGAATVDTTSAGAQTASGTATVTYSKAAAETGSANGSASANTGVAGAATISGASFTFTGTSATITSEVETVALADHSYTPEGTVAITPTAAGTISINNVTGAALAATPTFTGASATIAINGDVTGTAVAKHEAATLAVSGTQTISAHSHTVNVATDSKNVVTSVDANTGAAGKHSHTVDSHNHANDEIVLDDVTFTANGDDTFTAGSLPALTITDKTKMAQMASSTTVSVVTGISGGSGSFTSGTFTPNVPTAIDTTKFSGGSLSGTKTFNTDAIKSISGTKNYGFTSSVTDVMYGATVNNGVLSWSKVDAATQDAHTGDAASTGTVGFTPAAFQTGFYTAGTAAQHGADSHTHTAATITSTEKLTPVTIGSASGWSAGALPSFTQGAKASLTKSTVTVAGAASAVTLTSSEVADHTHSIGKTTVTLTYVTGATLATAGAATIQGSNFTAALPEMTHTVTQGSFSGSTSYTPEGTVSKPNITLTSAAKTVAVEGIKSVTAAFTGTSATIAHTFGTTATVELQADYQPEGSISGEVTIASHSHSYNAPAAHTHSITLTDATATGTAAVAVSSHTHSVTVASHTHSVSVSGNNYSA